MIIVKIGGGQSINRKGIVEGLAKIEGPYVIVHGANFERDRLAKELGREKRVVTSLSGYSSVFSDESAIELIMMAYSGLLNKRLVELCQTNGINAVGLSGIDGKLIQGKRNRGIKVEENGKKMLLRDFSGKPKAINTELLKLLLDNNYVPVISIPIVDENGIAINSENDDIVALLQAELKADKVIQFIEAEGFLDNKDDPNSLVSQISKLELKQREEQVEGRMKRKLLALNKLFENGATQVQICDGRVESPIESALAGNGTTIQ